MGFIFLLLLVPFLGLSSPFVEWTFRSPECAQQYSKDEFSALQLQATYGSNSVTCVNGMTTKNGLVSSLLGTELSAINGAKGTDTDILTLEIKFKVEETIGASNHALFGVFLDNESVFPLYVILIQHLSMLRVYLQTVGNPYGFADFTISPTWFTEIGAQYHVFITLKVRTAIRVDTKFCFGKNGAVITSCTIVQMAFPPATVLPHTLSTLNSRIRAGGLYYNPNSANPQTITYYRIAMFNRVLLLSEVVAVQGRTMPPTVPTSISPTPLPSRLPTSQAPSFSPSSVPSIAPITPSPTTRLSQCQNNVLAQEIFNCNFSQLTNGTACPPYLNTSSTQRYVREGYGTYPSSTGFYGEFSVAPLPQNTTLIWWSKRLANLSLAEMSVIEGNGSIVLGSSLILTLSVTGFVGEFTQEDRDCYRSRPPFSYPVVKSHANLSNFYFSPEFWDVDGDPVTHFKVTKLPTIGRLYYFGGLITQPNVAYAVGSRLQYKRPAPNLTDTFFVAGWDGYGEYGPSSEIFVNVLPNEYPAEDSVWMSLRDTEREPRILYTFKQRECTNGAIYSSHGLYSPQMSFFALYELVTPSNDSILCLSNPSFLGTYRQGANLPNLEQSSGRSYNLVNRNPIKEPLSFLTGYMDNPGFAYSVEAWFSHESLGDIRSIELLIIREITREAAWYGDLKFNTHISYFMSSLMITRTQSYIQFRGECFTDLGPEFYFREVVPNMYHLVFSFRITRNRTEWADYEVSTYYSRDGFTQDCQKNGSFRHNLNDEQELNFFNIGEDYRMYIDDANTGMNGIVHSLAIYDYKLSREDVDKLVAAGPPKSVPVIGVNQTITVYEDLISSVNLSLISYFDYDGDTPTQISIYSLPISGVLSHFDGSPILGPFPVKLSMPVVLIYLPDSNAFGCVSGLSVKLSDDNISESPVAGTVALCIQEINDAPQPVSNPDPVSVIRWQSVFFTLGFNDPDDLISDVFGNRPVGAMVQDNTLRQGAHITFTSAPLSNLRYLPTCANQVPFNQSVLGYLDQSFTFCFNATNTPVGQYTIKYNFTDPANLTGDEGNITISVLSPLLSCPVSPWLRPSHLPPCISYDSFVYLEGRDVNNVLLPISFKINSLPTNGTLLLNGPSPRPLILGETFTSSLVPNVLFTPPSLYYSAAEIGVFEDLAGNPLRPPHSFVFQVTRSGEYDSLNYTYQLHVVAPSSATVQITSLLSEIIGGKLNFTLSSPLGDIRLIEVRLHTNVGSMRIKSPWSLLSQADLQEGSGCSWGDSGHFKCNQLVFQTYPSLANSILTYLEYQPPSFYVRNRTSYFEVDIRNVDTLAQVGLLRVPIVSNLTSTDTTSIYEVARLTAVILGCIGTGALCLFLCSIYATLLVICRV